MNATPTEKLIIDGSATSTQNPIEVITPAPTVTTTPDLFEKSINNNRVIEKLNNLPNCQLPCRWGITPGETRWDQAKAILDEFDEEIAVWPLLNGEQRVFMMISIILDDGSLNIVDVKINLKEGVVRLFILVQDFNGHLGDIQTFLLENGKPDEIWIHSLANNMGGPPPFDVWFLYWEKGIAAKFFRSEKSAKYGFDGLIHACIEGGPNLYLWSDQISSLSELDTIFSKGFNMPDYMGFTAPHYRLLPVDEAIGLSLDEFYTQFTESTEQACFISDPDLWPEP